jgi:hypothetical protein
VAGSTVVLEDLMSYPPGGPPDVFGVHHNGTTPEHSPDRGDQGALALAHNFSSLPCQPHRTGFTVE